MSEVMEKEEQLTTAPETEVQPVREAKPSLGQKWKNLPKKKRRRIVRWLVVLVILAALAGVLWKVFGGKDGGKTEVMTAEVQYGSITSTVEGSGMTRAKKQRGHHGHHRRHAVRGLCHGGPAGEGGRPAVHRGFSGGPGGGG